MKWPERPSAHTEQRELAFGGTLEAEFMAWRATPQGRDAWRFMREKAFHLLDTGNQRLSAKHLVELMRYALRIRVNNDHTPLIARSLEDENPELRGRFKHRVRAA